MLLFEKVINQIFPKKSSKIEQKKNTHKQKKKEMLKS